MPRRRNPAWYRSPWVIGSAVVGAGALVGAGIVSAAAGGVDCSGVGPEGGTVAGVRYLERLRGGSRSDERLPMVIVLHGLGGTPEGYAAGFGGIGKARVILPEGAYEGGGGRKWWERGLHDIVEEGRPEDIAQWNAASDRLSEFIRQITKCRPTLGKPIVTGGSQGGEATLLVATQHRRQISAAVSVDGDMPDLFWRRRMAPTLMINGTGDTTVPFAWAKAHAEAAISRGSPLVFWPMPSEGHAITSAMSKAWLGEIGRQVERIWQG